VWNGGSEFYWTVHACGHKSVIWFMDRMIRRHLDVYPKNAAFQTRWTRPEPSWQPTALPLGPGAWSMR
jgi:hypothetical protein